MDISNKYLSKRQSFADTYEGPFVEYKCECNITLSGGSYDIELPNQRTINGVVTKSVYSKEKGCHSLELGDRGFLFIFQDRLFLNLVASGSYVCNFFLENYTEPSFSEKITKEIENDYTRNLRLYGELGANCIAKGIVVPGVDVGVVLEVFGPNSRNVLMERVSFDGKEVELAIWAYNDKYVVFENAIVVFVNKI